MNRKHKTAVKWVCGAAAVSALALAVGGWLLFGRFVTAANSIRKLEDELYAMEYEGDYGFEAFLAGGGAASDREVAQYLTGFFTRGLYKTDAEMRGGAFGCSFLSAQDEHGVVFFGRNYDGEECRAVIVRTEPQDGYESVSTCCLEFLGFGDSWVPDGSLMQRIQTLAAVYVPLDGMNEKGLVVADLMAGDREETHQDTGRPDVTTTTAIRLLLDRAADVEEALALLAQYDMHSSAGIAHHLALADAGGRCVVVEYVDGEMLVTETKVITNHYLADCEKQGVGSVQSHLRFDALAAHTGPADELAVRDLLESVAQKNYPQTAGSYEKTMWSIVYCPLGRCADFYFAENYEHCYGLLLQEKGSFLKQ